jgi:hypothetical protein
VVVQVFVKPIDYPVPVVEDVLRILTRNKGKLAATQHWPTQLSCFPGSDQPQKGPRLASFGDELTTSFHSAGSSGRSRRRIVELSARQIQLVGVSGHNVLRPSRE